MSPTDLYQQVAEAYHAQNKFQERDRFLVLALDAAQTEGQNSLSEQIRQRLLELNPNHLIKPYPSSAAALQAQNFITYLSQLRKNFPPAKAQALLQELGGPVPARPKRTMLADHSFPLADAIDDRKSPTWSQVSLEPKAKPTEGPSISSYHLPEPVLTSPTIPMKTPADPLANIPVAPPTFNFEQPARPKPPVTRQPEIVPAPSRRSSSAIESPTNIWVGNLLFLVLFLASIALLAYIFVLPFYPEVAKMLKPAS